MICKKQKRSPPKPFEPAENTLGKAPHFLVRVKKAEEVPSSAGGSGRLPRDDDRGQSSDVRVRRLSVHVERLKLSKFLTVGIGRVTLEIIHHSKIRSTDTVVCA